MWKQFYARVIVGDGPIFALLLFMTVFVAAILWTTIKRRRGEYDALARLPLADDATGARRSDKEILP